MLAAVPACLGAILGAAAVYIDRNQILDPDVAGFQQLARDMTLSNVFGGLREPLWPLLLVAPVHLFGSDSAIAIRFVGVLGFVWLIVASQLLIRQLFGSVWSLAGAAVLAVDPWLVFQSARGLREEAAAGMIMFVCFLLARPKPTSRRFLLLFGLAGITGLLRWDGMVVMLPVLGLALVRDRPSPLTWGLGPALVAVLVGPLLIANYVEYGDPLYHSNSHARFFRNIEFQGQPGFAGPPITWTQYVFGLHSKTTLVERAVKSFETIPFTVVNLAVFTPNAASGDSLWSFGAKHVSWLGPRGIRVVELAVLSLIWALCALGGVVLLRTRAWAVPAILVETILLYSPIANLIDYRLVLTVFPLMLVSAIAAVHFSLPRVAVSRWVPRPLRSWRSSSASPKAKAGIAPAHAR